MNLESVTYRRLYNLGNYENEVIEASMLVGDDDPEQILESLCIWCDLQHQRKQLGRGAAQAMEETIRSSEQLLIRLKGDIQRMKDTWQKHVDILSRLGIELPWLYERRGVDIDDIPF